MDTRYETPWGIFAWDEEKREKNVHKHKLDFLDAVTVFKDSHATIRYDAVHSIDEDRYRIVGSMQYIAIIAVFYTERNAGNELITRIISARRATKQEVKEYVIASNEPNGLGSIENHDGR